MFTGLTSARLLALVPALAACGPSGSAELKLAHAAPPGSLIDEAAEEFARVANERLAVRA